MKKLIMLSILCAFTLSTYSQNIFNKKSELAQDISTLSYKPPAAVSTTKMNILYLGLDNPISVAVSGYQSSDLVVSMSNGSITAVNKDGGKYLARPSKEGIVTFTIYFIEENRISQVSQEFRVKTIPAPISYVRNTAGGVVTKAELMSAGGVSARLGDFGFAGIQFRVTSFTLSGFYKGESYVMKAKGARFNSKMKRLINNARSGSTINISDIEAKRTDGYGKTKRLSNILLKLK